MQHLKKENADNFFKNKMPELVGAVTENLEPRWGIMSARHMMEHLVFALKSSNGGLMLKQRTPEEKIAKYRTLLFSDFAIAPGYRHPDLKRDRPMPLEYESLAVAKSAFWEEWNNFEKYFGEDSNPPTMHVAYGPLDYEGWRVMHFKHLVHHFTQFGLTTPEEHGLRTFEP